MAERADSTVALMSIHPRWSEAILDGTKTIELRRRAPTRPLSHLVIYATSPISRIVGWAEVDNVDRDTPAKLWNRWRTKAGVSQSEFKSYFDGSDLGYAILLSSAQRISEPLKLSTIGIARPPQSFQYLNGDARLIPGLGVCENADRIVDLRATDTSVFQATLVS